MVNITILFRFTTDVTTLQTAMSKAINCRKYQLPADTKQTTKLNKAMIIFLNNSGGFTDAVNLVT